VSREHIHTWEDGSGPRRVFLDGRGIQDVAYADTKDGALEVLGRPPASRSFDCRRGKTATERNRPSRVCW
jgi:hypothetical protein